MFEYYNTYMQSTLQLKIENESHTSFILFRSRKDTGLAVMLKSYMIHVVSI